MSSVLSFSFRTRQESYNIHLYPSLSFLFLLEPSCQKRLISNHRGRKKFLSFLNLFQFSTRGWPRALDDTKPQEKRIASPPTSFKDKHEVDFSVFRQKIKTSLFRKHHVTKKQFLMMMMIMMMLLIICF